MCSELKLDSIEAILSDESLLCKVCEIVRRMALRTKARKHEERVELDIPTLNKQIVTLTNFPLLPKEMALISLGHSGVSRIKKQGLSSLTLLIVVRRYWS
jgi:hypothetical protein